MVFPPRFTNGFIRCNAHSSHTSAWPTIRSAINIANMLVHQSSRHRRLAAGETITALVPQYPGLNFVQFASKLELLRKEHFCVQAIRIYPNTSGELMLVGECKNVSARRKFAFLSFKIVCNGVLFTYHFHYMRRATEEKQVHRVSFWQKS